MGKKIALLLLATGLSFNSICQVKWEHISTSTDGIEAPDRGNQQTSAAIAGFDNDGDPDILGKPYDGDTPRLDIWLQNGTGNK